MIAAITPIAEMMTVKELIFTMVVMKLINGLNIKQANVNKSGDFTGFLLRP